MSKISWPKYVIKLVQPSSRPNCIAIQLKAPIMALEMAKMRDTTFSTFESPKLHSYSIEGTDHDSRNLSHLVLKTFHNPMHRMHPSKRVWKRKRFRNNWKYKGTFQICRWNFKNAHPLSQRTRLQQGCCKISVLPLTCAMQSTCKERDYRARF